MVSILTPPDSQIKYGGRMIRLLALHILFIGFKADIS